MKIKGYSGYHGRKKRQKATITLILVVVALLCGAFLLLQNYFVYDDSGKIRLDLPFLRQEEGENPPLKDDEVHIDILAPEGPEEGDATLRPVKELHARLVGSLVLKRDPEKTLYSTPEPDIVIEVKRVNGSITYASEALIPEEVDVTSGDTMNNLKTILAGDKYVVARLSTFCDSYFVRAYRDAALLRDNGGYWYDADSRTWLDPTHPQTTAYITSLCQELTALGFDELMLDHFAYPVTGNTAAIDGLAQTDREAVLADFVAALRANLPENTVMGIVLRNDLSAEDGINAELITKYFDRVYVASHVDVAALQEELGSGYGAERIVAMTGKAPESGSYMIG